MATFTSIPILDLSLINLPCQKAKFLAQLREALVVVGFFYLKNITLWIPESVKSEFEKQAMALCNQPLEKKLEIDMINSKHFLGYSRQGLERTARKLDYREMFDFLTPQEAPGPDDPVYLNIQGPNQWPDEKELPGFRKAVEDYLSVISELGNLMVGLVAEALDIEPTTMRPLFGNPPRNKLSLLKYPVPPNEPPRDQVETDKGGICQEEDDVMQGVGPHKDGGFLTYLLQSTPHAGLEAQNKCGSWIPVPPLPDTLVVNVGRSLESITGGVCTATTHRVNLRAEYFRGEQGESLGPRFSFPVFQTLRPDVSSAEMQSLELPPHILDLVKDEKVRSDAEAYFSNYHRESPGLGIFTARLTSHPDVGRRWYPDLVSRVLKEQEDFNNGGIVVVPPKS
ncbi:putative oxidoreductase [Xylaria telfairii]|nr:putative oxidoreductase [Xylaria telfairii]